VIAAVLRGTKKETTVYARIINVYTGKIFPIQAIKAHGGSRGIVPLILNLATG
jgi:hypothetical protein